MHITVCHWLEMAGALRCWYSHDTIWVHFGCILGTVWVHFWYNLGTLWVHFGYILGTLWVHFGYTLGFSLWVHFGAHNVWVCMIMFEAHCPFTMFFWCRLGAGQDDTTPSEFMPYLWVQAMTTHHTILEGRLCNFFGVQARTTPHH